VGVLGQVGYASASNIYNGEVSSRLSAFELFYTKVKLSATDVHFSLK
jgi:hypothetical protein